MASSETAEHLKDSAGAMAQSGQQVADGTDRRTELAVDRTVLAEERTYAAWMRTGVGALASGVGARPLLQSLMPGWVVTAAGTILILFSGFCFVAAVWRQFDKVAPPPPDTRRIPRVLVVGMNGVLMLVVLAALAGVWFGAPRAH